MGWTQHTPFLFPGRERLGRCAVTRPLQHEGAGLVLPDDPVEVEELGELELGIVREANPGVREGRLAPGRTGLPLLAQDAYPPPPIAPANATPV